ncbi:unnamed protein product [Nezara viridula]|uniref:Uncharacterized protein n=1 Tax=Nezara viridula TaxID=85310 RepID=A0A9P0H2Q1_NEZVI|nr:unnamed protein product [Nezara viridula]
MLCAIGGKTSCNISHCSHLCCDIAFQFQMPWVNPASFAILSAKCSLGLEHVKMRKNDSMDGDGSSTKPKTIADLFNTFQLLQDPTAFTKASAIMPPKTGVK